MNQDSIFKVLSVAAVIAIIGLLGYSAYILYYEVPERSRVGVAKQATLDQNEGLKATIDTLEIMWKERQKYSFYVQQDPLHLGRVINDFKYADERKGEGEEEYEIRLSATVIDDNPKAIIRYNGKSFVVQAGDQIGTAYRVLKIEKMQVILDNKGKRIVLKNKRATSGENSSDNSEYSNTNDYGSYNY